MEYKYTNHLISEKSPYLLQHAHNPVNWYPWGTKAFEAAKREDKPVFLSIGYSTCHWCHVMEHESFEDEQTAEILNADFISIKVDREERPDIDSVYMSVCQAITGSGGWPMTIIMTPEQKPFFAGTYLPKSSRYKMTGLDDLLFKIAELWRNDRKSLSESAEKISAHFSKTFQNKTAGEMPSKELIFAGANALKRSFDNKNGGFGNAPKFPTPHNLLLLMKYSQAENDIDALRTVETTLIQMYRGGIFDHVGGGFSRYSTDEKWLVPHFEKMLYDNALLTVAYTEAFRITGNNLYKTVAERTIGYVLSELTHDNGGFFCGQDADSDGIEGKYYVFSPDEIKSVLGETDGEFFCKHFNITEIGNFEGKSIPNLLKNENFEQADNHIDKFCKKLYDYRINRTKLHKDDKILVSWNALMISALASAYGAFGEEKYLDAAKKACQFIEKNLADKDDRLMVRWRDGEAAGNGTIDDYAFYAWALTEMYRVTFNIEYLNRACAISKIMCDRFFDEESGGFYLYSDDGEQLISRPKELFDNAIPSGNSAAAYVLQKLFSLTAENFWREKLDKQMSFLVSESKAYSMGFSFSLYAMINVLYSQENLVCVSAESGIEKKILSYLKERKKSDVDVIIKTPKNASELKNLASFTSEYPILENGTMYYLCRNGVCLAPVNDIEDLF